MPTCEQSSGEAESLGNVSIAKTSKTGAFFCRVRTASFSKMTVFDGPQATQLTRCHPGSLSHPVFLFLAQPHDDVQVPHWFSSLCVPVRFLVRFRYCAKRRSAVVRSALLLVKQKQNTKNQQMKTVTYTHGVLINNTSLTPT